MKDRSKPDSFRAALVQNGNDKRKAVIKQYWESEPCGTRYSNEADRLAYFADLERVRYQMEPHILELADFRSSKGRKVLEIGVGAGIDFANWVKAGAIATGVDLTESGLSLAKEWLALLGYRENPFQLLAGDAEDLPFLHDSFDIVFAYGVLHHTPDTVKAFQEAYRVLFTGGQLRCMIYHVPSWTAINLWLYHGLLQMRPWKSLRDVVYENLESPGTKAYTGTEARALLKEVGFKNIDINLFLGGGDLLTLKLSRKYERNSLVRWAVTLYPRSIIKRLGNRLGTLMCITAVK